MSDEIMSEENEDTLCESQELLDEYLLAEKNSIRVKIQSDVEAFLASGGAIREIAPNIVADPPKKPQSNYGGQPI